MAHFTNKPWCVALLAATLIGTGCSSPSPKHQSAPKAAKPALDYEPLGLVKNVAIYLRKDDNDQKWRTSLSGDILDPSTEMVYFSVPDWKPTLVIDPIPVDLESYNRECPMLKNGRHDLGYNATRSSIKRQPQAMCFLAPMPSFRTVRSSQTSTHDTYLMATRFLPAGIQAIVSNLCSAQQEPPKCSIVL